MFKSLSIGRRLAIGFATGKMDHHIRSPRVIALCRAIYQSLGVSR